MVSMGFVIMNQQNEFYSYIRHKDKYPVFIHDFVYAKVYDSEKSAQKKLQELLQLTNEPLFVCEV